ncbi:alpha/beta hydrolase [Candidatus Liberibacter asiaticus]|uniref:Lysophospholipase protein n=2 Tax=Liberibacter asiaticus TaxID=34021 RepID=C6XHK4_LIBAP|nr:alpha/beta hydrolase [Candidatus Liberibacter asiaticus]ACT56747.1 lysophospholipase protein [Candidatus Liberibacter asiaticus str. psy62]AGH16514.1 lysophospholipase protein [Candidatus Liberibacter asiaticus str. gxpsy]ALK06913.1 lysophospholipase [Candidatus Liberibacter asiaticus]ASK52385.1 lysophospholipase [Candidatus Liberibacter asiaticus]AWL13708.1 lysophospholipase [Candidatus Liberibacter asiaticus]
MSQKTFLTEDETIHKSVHSYNQTHKTPRAIILACQSIEENIEDYNDFREYFAEENVAVYIYSYRNTIKTTSDYLRDYPKNTSDTTIVCDVMKLRTLISEKHGNTSVLLFGYSLGTIIALSTLLKYPQKFSGIALWNLDLCFEKYSCMLMTLLLKIEKFFKGSDTPSRLMRHLTTDLWNRNNQNWKNFLKDHSVKKNSQNYILDSNHIPISVWLEFMSMATDISSRGSFNPLSRFIPFCLIGGGNVSSKIEDLTQTYKLTTRLQNEEFYDISLMSLPPTMHSNDPHNVFPPPAIKKLRNWIVNSYLPKVIPLISQHKK